MRLGEFDEEIISVVPLKVPLSLALSRQRERVYLIPAPLMGRG